MQNNEMTLINKIKIQQDRQSTYNVTLRRFRETIAARKLQ
jgi:hypothetical protein